MAADEHPRSETGAEPNDFVHRLRSVIGRGGPARVAKDPITRPAIRIWCEAVDDWNPAYLDPTWAQESRWGDIIAPATSLNMWTLPGNRRSHPVGEPLDRINEILFSHGFTSVAAVQTEHTYRRPLRPGDHLQQFQHIGMVTEEKRTALGRGHFLDLVSDYRTLDGEPVGTVTLRMLRWDPRTSPPREGSTSPTGSSAKDLGTTPPPRPARQERTRTAGEVHRGQRLGPWSIPVSQASIAALATATYDFNDVHLDRDAAHARGAPDVYLNILGSAGLVNCLLTDWAGPESELTGLRVRLGRQCHPGDTLTLTGEVTAVDDDRATVQVRGRNRLGDHLTGEVTVRLPT